MSRNTMNFLLDLVSMMVMLTLAATGLLMHFVLPHGSGGLAVLGLTRHQWGDVHFYVAISAVALAVVHVWLHWSWVCTVVGRAFGRDQPAKRVRSLIGAGLLILLATIFTSSLLWARGTVTGSGGRGAGSQMGEGYGLHGGPYR